MLGSYILKTEVRSMTKVHETEWLKIGKAVPDGAVNLICYTIKKPDISENVQTTTMIDKTLPQFVLLTRRSDGKLSAPASSPLFLLTDKIEEGEPLYYIYTLQYKVRSNKPIQITSEKGYVPKTYHFQQEFIPEENGLYTVRIYTNFWADKIASFYVVYNGIDNDGKLIPGIREFINPRPYMSRVDSNPTWNTYKLTEVENGFEITVGGQSQNYYLLALDSGNISAKDPIEIDGKWYPRIINGNMSKFNPHTKMPERMSYSIPDYYAQEFFNDMPPYMQITEMATVINQNTIKVKNTPIYAPIVNGSITNITVIVKSRLGAESKTIQVSSVDSHSGIIYLAGMINYTDPIEVTYCYLEDAFIYKGYTDEKTGQWVPLDINPCVGHEYGEITQEGKLVIKPSFELLNKTVYIYAIPSEVKVNPINVNDEQHEIPENIKVGQPLTIQLNYMARTDARFIVRTKYSNKVIPRQSNTPNICTWHFSGNATYVRSIIIENAYILCGEPILVDYLRGDNNYQTLKRRTSNTLFHTTRQLSIEEQDEKRAIMVAKIYVRPNSSKEEVKLIDTRTRGGGFIDINDELRKIINPESEYFLDISHISGKPLQENAVVIIKIDRRILKEFGGTFEKSDVEAAVHKHIALGVLPVIEYINPTEHNVLV